MTSEIPLGRDPKTSLGMPPELFNLATQGQSSSRGTPSPATLNASDTQSMTPNESASQPMDQEASVSQLVNEMTIQNQPVFAS